MGIIHMLRELFMGEGRDISFPDLMAFREMIVMEKVKGIRIHNKISSDHLHSIHRDRLASIPGGIGLCYDSRTRVLVYSRRKELCHVHSKV
jgi:hypothetical protein